MLPAGVAGQDRNPVVSALHPSAAAHKCVNKVRVIKDIEKIKLSDVPSGTSLFFFFLRTTFFNSKF